MKRWWWLLVLVGIWLGPAQVVKAEGAGFTVTPELPDNQVGGDTGWFNLLVAPGKQQSLTVAVANQSDQTKRLRLQLTDAYTQANGQVGYAPNQHSAVQAPARLTAIGSKPLTVSLPAHTGRKVTFQVTLPKAHFDGQILGAIYVQDRTKQTAESSSGFAITNQFAMVVAVQLQNAAQLVAPALRLNSVKVKATQIVARIENPKPRLFGQIAYTTEIRLVGQKKVQAEQRDKGFQMAPNSYFDYPITLNKALAPGKYRLTTTAKAGDAQWTMTKDFTLTATAAARLAPPPKVPAQAPRGGVWWLWAIALVIVLFIGIGLGNRRKRE